MAVEYKGDILAHCFIARHLFPFSLVSPTGGKKKQPCQETIITCLYLVVPEGLQNDNGGELQKHVRNFCNKNKIKMIKNCKYNPKAQEEAEISSCLAFRNILRRDAPQKTGVNWAKSLPEDIKFLNMEKKRRTILEITILNLLWQKT